MKEQYIEQVKKRLTFSCKQKEEIVRDLYEAFASALEHGQTEQQVIERLGSPTEFVREIEEQLGVDRATQSRRKNTLYTSISCIIAIASLVAYSVARAAGGPANTIGFARGSTNITVNGAFDITILFLIVGVIALIVAAIHLCLFARNNRRYLCGNK